MINTIVRINGEKVVVPPTFCDEARQFPTSIPCPICCDEICLEYQGTDPTSHKAIFKMICSHKIEIRS